MRILQIAARLLLRHPATALFALLLAAALMLWMRSGRHFDSVELLTPKVILTVHSEMRVLMVTASAHDDSGWDLFHSSDISTVEAPWVMAVWPRIWGGPRLGEVGLAIVLAHLIGLLVLLGGAAFAVECWLTKRRLRHRETVGAETQLSPD